ncbi:MAG: amidohydrolase family protein [Lachnospiraceae bacterium]|nr:amidohydrolase family protein [Lachnospiraceae bacterium]
MLIINGKLLLDKDFDYHDLVIENGRIAEILTYRSGRKDPDTYDARGSIVVPGLIDMEVHGAVGYDMSDACDEAYDAISRDLIRRGVTSFIGAVDSFSEDILEEAYGAAGEWMKKQAPGADMIGLAMRGPFLNPAAAGPHDRNALRKPDAALYHRLQELSGGKIRIVNVSPELEGAEPFILEVGREAMIALSNSEAGFDVARRAFALKARGCGDLYRDMTQFTLTDPGLIGAAMDIAQFVTLRFDNDDYIHPSMLRMAFNEFWGRLCLVSGMTAFTGIPAGKYEIEGHTVTKKRDRARFEDGTDAGSAVGLDACMSAILGMGSVPSPLVYRAASEIPARILGIFDEVGSITVGKRADLTILDLHTQNVQSVLKNGVMVYDERKEYV